MNLFAFQIRNETLECILVSRSSAERFSEKELSVILTLFQTNLLIESSSDRQNFISVYKRVRCVLLITAFSHFNIFVDTSPLMGELVP